MEYVGGAALMSTSVVLPWDDALIHYDFGPSHPLNPIRVELTMRLARSLGCSTSTTCPS